MADVILHNRPEGAPSDNEFIAYGTPTTPSGQIKMSNFYTLLMDKLGFFKVNNLFSEIFGDLTKTATAQNNLDVYGRIAMNGVLDTVAYSDNVIEKNSTIAFTPIIPTHPANKGYVDKRIQAGKLLINGLPTGTFSNTVTLPFNMGDTNYSVVATIMNTDLFLTVQDPRVVPITNSASFEIALSNVGPSISSVFYVNWVAVKY